jgi:hypothetical protein
LGGSDAEADNYAGLEKSEFAFEPGAAGVDFACVGLGVEAALAPGSGFPFEMFYGVGHVDFAAIYFQFFEGAVEQFAGGTDEGAAFDVFVVAGLFADEDDFGGLGSFTEDGLGGIFVEGAALAVAGGARQFGERGVGIRGEIFAGIELVRVGGNGCLESFGVISTRHMPHYPPGIAARAPKNDAGYRRYYFRVASCLLFSFQTVRPPVELACWIQTREVNYVIESINREKSGHPGGGWF